MFERFFRLSENRTDVRTELLAGLTTFLTMAYIIFVQPAVLSGRMFGFDTGMDYGAVTVATCVSAALATAIMGLYAGYPIAQAPGMGENFIFVLTLIPAARLWIDQRVAAGLLEPGATADWQIALGVVFISGVLFLVLSLCGVRELLLDTISPNMRNAIAAGIGLFIAFIGLQGATLVIGAPGHLVGLNPHVGGPDLVVFFFGLLLTAGLYALDVRGSIIWGIVGATVLALVLKYAVPLLPYPASMPRHVALEKISGPWGVHVELAWSQQTTEPQAAITVTRQGPSAKPARLSLEFMFREQPGSDTGAVRHAALVEVPAGVRQVGAALALPRPDAFRAYAVNVLVDGQPVPELSQPWTPVPVLPALVADSKLLTQFKPAQGVVSAPPSVAPTFWKMDLRHALAWAMIPFILIFLFMNLFDTLGTLVGVSEQAGFIKDNKLPRAKEALVSDAVGTVAGAALGTSTVVSFIESAAGVQQGGRTGLTALTTAVLFILALFFSPLIEMVGSYPSITAPALVVVGSMMMRNATKIDWANYAEAMPAFLTILAIPLTYSIADGLALGFISYPIIKALAGQGREVRWLNYVMAAVLAAYLVLVRSEIG